MVLATAVVNKLGTYFPGATIDFLVRKGNESLLNNNPYLHEVLVWDKKEQKYRNLFRMIKKVRKEKYDLVVNLQRFFSTGLITALSGAKRTVGFDKNPLSFLFSRKVKHLISETKPYRHEVERNNDLINDITDDIFVRPELFPSAEDFALVNEFCQAPYITMSPSSVWFTKRYPFESWVKLAKMIPADHKIYLLGGKENTAECEELRRQAGHPGMVNLAGKLSFLQSAALMKGAFMNYVNDSAPLHFASAMNAPVTAIFCSTAKSFGFTPLSDHSIIAEIDYELPCRPCGLHGKKECPQQHFKCGHDIRIEKLLAPFASHD